MHNSDDDQLIDTGIEQLLENCRFAYEQGFTPAIYEAACICEENNAPIPIWMRGALPVVLASAFSLKKKSMGLPKLTWEIRHYLRWLTVHTLVSNGEKWKDAYKKTCDEFSKNNAQPEAIKKSYKKIESFIKSTTEYSHLYFILLRVSDRLGIDVGSVLNK